MGWDPELTSTQADPTLAITVFAQELPGCQHLAPDATARLSDQSRSKEVVQRSWPSSARLGESWSSAAHLWSKLTSFDGTGVHINPPHATAFT